MRKLFFFKIFQFKTISIIWLFNLILLIFIAGLIYFNSPRLNPPLVIHFDSYKGVDFLGEVTTIWGIWLAIFVFNILNMFLTEFFLYRERFLSYFSTAVSAILNLLLLVVIGTIISLN
ncbi:hypothetical protein COY65_01285 [Candidatus Jorgensenbacteria bacterium CG_4_10_14_0_8_um_filter_39_13]|uniref:DUF1648 domain-containing protein n=2 Tax=Candidatus Joergenseniibacteriota TaxID=1752739 RepID=A0A2M7RI18_9BACT|nr:MAG: hypothetical protein COV54_01670 [Candidatus Jorgensenbacteria bacterium CG11_big_fil_rev_8_21_14_0_20_38_23]PIV12950.1 MAG: hypothetical protein COS46_02830 [Candidatus Jorgensenbacteria bacterium CG03_land_8_20_14_0_80_38_39]PIW97771.1 MAG: hypothetical protein COZ81_00820 [Candidatus Jorgensenbacteria bacterium CG_4_8_14_3_um_filter_38_10]PIY96202.1 MAG: hypothetical protein COY65_01285 [Candidatus Jorgensenbacteria bacterium CG_4_10_14_0_8_um_filter_39_13]PJA95130.1 MAG: hypothetica